MANVRSKSESKRKQILVAATLLFTEQGYSSTSMDLIAKNAGVSKQTVYSHFGSKDELFAASIKQKCDSYQMTEISLDTASEPAEILFILAKRFLAMLTSKEALAIHKICAYESKSYPQISELFYQEGPERIVNDVAKLMAEFDNKQQLIIPEAKFAALQFLNMVKGECWMRLEFNTKKQISESEINRYLDSSIAMFIKGYST
ncbi:TetR/AcrR family transcriptional regulator [Colwellia sp. M166]|uniref:TetR/AcrR family transcriptional regulator n=1 Tax=Colwellia sp. M166 TaxID=2583805 RepID=UPI00211DFC48|nr:TetR/AcrR family transcriptional regulator [Colwellia sp. M166]UUO24190.1 TetR/AcrR family transcriptional regulator [Colwellia sp. M166]|tara:strand:+ start:36184 stop:36792 length:609 start_codon:yes stop_codon:yes gene_type:complete